MSSKIKYITRVYNRDKMYHPLREARIKANLSQSKLGSLAGVDPRTIGNIEHYRIIPWNKIMMQLARALDVPVNELFPEWKIKDKIND